MILEGGGGYPGCHLYYTDRHVVCLSKELELRMPILDKVHLSSLSPPPPPPLQGRNQRGGILRAGRRG